MPESNVETASMLQHIRTGHPCHCLMCVCCYRAFPQRSVMVILTALGVALAYTHRVCLNLAIVEMTHTVPVNLSDYQLTGRDQKCVGTLGTRPVIEDIQGGKFDWDEETQSHVLGSFYYGYLICHIPTSFLCDRYGTKHIFLLGLIVSTIATALIPLGAVYCGWVMVCFLRFLAGCGQAPIFPGIMEIIARWIPPQEQALVSGVVNSALSVGTIVGNIPTAYIMKYTRSWTLVFYFFTLLSIVWCVCYWFFVYSTPAKHPYITLEEKEYLDKRITPHVPRHRPPTGLWKDPVFYSIACIQLGHDYCLFTIITNIPKYFNNVLMFSSDMTAYLVCLPQLSSFMASFFWGSLADYLIFKRGLKKTYVRLVYALFGCFIPALCIIIMCNLRCSKYAAVAMVCLAMACITSFYSSIKVTCIDISQTQTGLVTGMSNGVGGIAGFVAPLTIGKICKDNTFPQWDMVSYITACVGLVCTIPYLLFCKAYRSEWDYLPEEEKPEFEKGFKAKLSCYKMV